MAFKIVKRNKIRVPVKGIVNGEDGKPVNFNFVLLCSRLTQTEIEAAVRDKDESVLNFIQRVITGWEDVLDDSGAPMAFDSETLDAVMEQPGLPVLCYQQYLKEITAIAKN